MKLKQIVVDETNLTLTKEKRQVKFGEIFEVSDLRGNEILKATFKDHPVAEIVKEDLKAKAKAEEEEAKAKASKGGK